MRLFLEKVLNVEVPQLCNGRIIGLSQNLTCLLLLLKQIRPIDKKMQYQIQKLTRVSGTATESGDLKAKESGTQEKPEDLLKYRPNPDMLASKTDASAEVINFYPKTDIFSSLSFNIIQFPVGLSENNVTICV